MTQQGRLLDGITILIFYWFMPNQTTEMNYACFKSYWFKLLLQIMGFQGHGVYGYSARKTSPGIVTRVPCHLMVAITHAKQGISQFHHWLTLNYNVPRQLSYGVVVPKLWLNKEDFWMELLYWYPIGLCQYKLQKWTMHVLNPTGLNCFCK